MKKAILMLITIVTLTLCDCCYCPVCGEWSNDCTCNRNYVNYKGGDYFCAKTLLGTWQCDYPTIVGNMEIKQINFIDDWNCDITYAIGREPDWYTHTYRYSYSNKCLRFSRNGSTFSFIFNGYLFPELYLKDSRYNYTWRKVRSYGCGY